ncbi:MAG: UDP-N-acetylmuramoyl-L-alanyl-D-glutamate--2,6-diaminopimelate ligase, partial [Chitinophagales bacterium]
MKEINSILEGVQVIARHGKNTCSVVAVCADSRKVIQGCVFIAVKGYQTDGHQFIADAIAGGAVCIVAEIHPESIPENIIWITVKNSAIALGAISHNFYDKPTTRLKLIGITGTNGKTSVATLCYLLAEACGYKSGLISTVENKIHHAVIPATHTTPDPVQLNALLADMVHAGCSHAFMEVSSHAAHQQRIAGLHYTGGVFTNITHDHLDYHQTFDNYIAAKKSFFDNLQSDAFALVNADDKRSGVMVQNCHARKSTYAVKSDADFRCRILENNLTGLVLQINNSELHTRLAGAFNAWNITAAFAVTTLLGLNAGEVLKALSVLPPVEGRFDTVHSPHAKITCVIDYAHTPDAVEKILSTIRDAVNADRKIITVIGCGGDRDKTKRPLMAKAAAQLSDKLILTSDNPRSEDPNAIIQEMEAGLSGDLIKKSLSVADRKAAIKTAVMMAADNDVILLAGKGHEKYQEIKGVKYPFDDKYIIQETFKTLD